MEFNNGIRDKENVLIKDLQLKIQILKSGVIEERNKRSENEKEISRLKKTLFEYESKINEQDNLICTLSKEKYEITTKLEIEKSKAETVATPPVNDFIGGLINGIFQRKDSFTTPPVDLDTKKLSNENKEMIKQIEMLQQKLKECTEDFDRCKFEYQNLLNLQMEKIRKAEQAIIEKNNEMAENAKQLQIMFDNYKKFDVERTSYESRIKELEEMDRLKSEKIIDLLTRLEDKESLLVELKENLTKHEFESAELARKLAELKNVIIEQNMVIQSFKGEKVNEHHTVSKPIEVSL
jgi:chromosome segregation ATPase